MHCELWIYHSEHIYNSTTTFNMNAAQSGGHAGSGLSKKEQLEVIHQNRFFFSVLFLVYGVCFKIICGVCWFSLCVTRIHLHTKQENMIGCLCGYTVFIWIFVYEFQLFWCLKRQKTSKKKENNRRRNGEAHYVNSLLCQNRFNHSGGDSYTYSICVCGAVIKVTVNPVWNVCVSEILRSVENYGMAKPHYVDILQMRLLHTEIEIWIYAAECIHESYFSVSNIQRIVQISIHGHCNDILISCLFEPLNHPTK